MMSANILQVNFRSGVNEKVNMKKFLFAFLVLASLQSGAQPNVTTFTWKVGTERSTPGATIKRLEGKNVYWATNISYDAPQKANKIKKQDRETSAEEGKPEAKGGVIELYITRADSNLVNFKWFTVIITDMTDNEIYREELPDTIPAAFKRPPSSLGSYISPGTWWNLTSIYIPEKIEGPFYVYVIDNAATENSRFKFLVTRK